MSTVKPACCICGGSRFEPGPKLHGHYRIYGRDLVAKLSGAMSDVGLLEVQGSDEVTGAPQRAYFAAYDERLLTEIRGAPSRWCKRESWRPVLMLAPRFWKLGHKLLAIVGKIDSLVD